jgi:hypothetical protein
MKSFMQPINTYERMYEQSIGNIQGYKKRLCELLTWDKPMVEKSKDCTGLWITWGRKIAALEGLIIEEYPRMKITFDNKIILGKSYKELDC